MKKDDFSFKAKISGTKCELIKTEITVKF